MLSKTRDVPVASPGPGVIPDTITTPVSNAATFARGADVDATHVKVSWVFGSSQASLVWLMLFAAILGWLLGLVASAAFHWRTRAPRRDDGTS